MTDTSTAHAIACDTTGCDQPATVQLSGGFNFCDVHRTDTAGRNDGMRAMTLRLPIDLHERYRTEAFNQRTSMSALMIAALYNAPRGANA